MRVLIIAHSRYKGGLSGSDAIYESFKKYWPCKVDVWDSLGYDFNPFFICYLWRICLSCIMATFERNRYDLVYTASDFLPDSLAGFIFKLRGHRWVAGYYLNAFKENKLHYYSQKFVKWLIRKYADMVIVTNPTMYHIFHSKKKTWINGGIELSLADFSYSFKTYDAVFCGRIHPSKGIDELLQAWDLIREKLPKARLALIGDGDLGVNYIKHKLFAKHGRNNYNGIDLLGYMGDERYDIYKQSKVVLYPTPAKYDHFSMAPVEAMACGCPIIHFDLNTFRQMEVPTPGGAQTIEEFASHAVFLIETNLPNIRHFVKDWAIQFDYKQQSLRVYRELCQRLTLT